jgi:ribonuclease BN (tRNA processing enzyme)
MNVRLALYAAVALMLALSWAGACVILQAAMMNAKVAPLPPREFSTLTLVTVGTGGAYENPDRLGPSLALGLGSRIWLVDVGRGVAEGLRAASIPVSQPDTVLLTSLLPESTLGLDDLLLTGWLAPRERSIRLIGPPGTAELAAGLLRAHAGGIRAGEQGLGLPPPGARLEVIEVEDEWSEEAEGLRIRAGAISGGPSPALAWRFEHGDRSLVITGTGWGADQLAAFASGADMWVHEAVFIPTPEHAEAAGVTEDPERLRREAAMHTSILEVGELASRAGVASLVLVRLRPPPMFGLQVSSLVSDSFEGSIRIPEDGDEIEP